MLFLEIFETWPFLGEIGPFWGTLGPKSPLFAAIPPPRFSAQAAFATKKVGMNAGHAHPLGLCQLCFVTNVDLACAKAD
jgi:hypothetical protein